MGLFWSKKAKKTDVTDTQKVSKAIKTRLNVRKTLTVYQSECLIRAVASGDLEYIDSNILEAVFDTILFLENQTDQNQRPVSSSFNDMIENAQWMDYQERSRDDEDEEIEELTDSDDDLEDEKEIADALSMEDSLKRMGIKIESGSASSKDIEIMNTAITKEKMPENECDEGCCGKCH